MSSGLCHKLGDTKFEALKRCHTIPLLLGAGAGDAMGYIGNILGLVFLYEEWFQLQFQARNVVSLQNELKAFFQLVAVLELRVPGITARRETHIIYTHGQHHQPSTLEARMPMLEIGDEDLERKHSIYRKHNPILRRLHQVLKWGRTVGHLLYESRMICTTQERNVA